MAVPVSPSLYWAGAAGMVTGIVVIGAFLRTSRREDISHGVLHLLVCVVGLFAYYSLVVDRTAIHAGDRIFYLSHYLYWILTQPLLFVAVALVALPPLANPGDRRLRASLFGGLVGATVAWTSAGLFQAWARTAGERWAWFALAGIGLAAVLWQLSFPVLHQGEIKGGAPSRLQAPGRHGGWRSPTKSWTSILKPRSATHHNLRVLNGDAGTASAA